MCVINPIWFYLINVCDDIRIAAMVMGALGAIAYISFKIAYICMLRDSRGYADELELCKCATNWLKWFVVLFIVGLLIPSESTCISMMIANTATTDNIATAQQTIKEMVDYIVDAITTIKGA